MKIVLDAPRRNNVRFESGQGEKPETPHTRESRQMRNETTECAKIIRKEIKTVFTGTKFSVYKSTGGSTIRIKWEGGPEWEDVQRWANRYTAGSFDSMTDSYSFRRTTEDGPRAMYIFCTRG